MKNLSQLCICIRGAGEMATGVAFRLHRSGFRRVFLLEQPAPLAVRRTVCFSEAVYHGRMTVEDVTAVLVHPDYEPGCETLPGTCETAWQAGHIPVLVDPQGDAVRALRPAVVIEATLAKCNVGVTLEDAPLVIGVGPGFTVGTDVHAIVESNRGPELGRVLYAGSAEPNTGIPGTVRGLSVERVLRAPCDGIFETTLDIESRVDAGHSVGRVNGISIPAAIGGMIRGLLPSGVRVTDGVKVGDIEPREGISCRKISEKALAIGGGVLEAVLHRYNGNVNHQ